MSETLFLTPEGLTGDRWQLKDASGARIGGGGKDQMVSWALENGYRVQIRDRSGKISWGETPAAAAKTPAPAPAPPRIERQNKIIGIAGRKGSGKSTITRELLAPANFPGGRPRIFIFDTMGEHHFAWERHEDLEQATMALLETPHRDEFVISYTPGDNLEKEFAEICDLVWDQGNMIFVVEELPMLASSQYSPPKFNKLVRTGRHRAVSLIYTCQRLSEVPRGATSATDVFVLFATTEPADLQKIKDRCGTEVAGQVQQLGDHGFLVFDVLARNLADTRGAWQIQILSTSGGLVEPR